MSKSKVEIRRTLLRASLTFPLISVFPIARSEPVTTAVVIAKVVAAVIAGLQALAGSRSEKAMKANVEAVLASVQLIITQQQVIIQDLKKIQKLIVENSLRSWQDAYSRDIDALAANLRVNLKDLEANRGRMTPKLRQDFSWIANECAKVTNAAGNLDPFTFVFFITGVGVVFVCEEVLKGSRTRLDAWKAEFVRPLNRWLDAKNAGSMPAIIAQTKSEIEVRRQILANRPAEYNIGTRTRMYDPDGETSCIDRISDYVTIHGDYTTGFSGVKRSATTESKCRTRIDRQRRSMFAAPGDFTPATPSEFPYINELNATRLEIRNLELAEADQRSLLAQMEEFRRIMLGQAIPVGGQGQPVGPTHTSPKQPTD